MVVVVVGLMRLSGAAVRAAETVAVAAHSGLMAHQWQWR